MFLVTSTTAASAPTLERLRSLRKLTNEIGKLVDDLKPFQHEDNQTFRRLPTDSSKKDDISITVTASCLMALTLGRRLREFYKDKYTDICMEVFQRIAKVPWRSSQLPECNAFTATLLLRAISIVGATDVAGIRTPTLKFTKKTPRIDDKDRAPLSTDCSGKAYSEIARIFAHKAPESLKVGEYPTSPVIMYWFIDAIDGLSVDVEDHWWPNMADWAAKELRRQISLVAAEAHDRMDPVAMAMAACLAQKLRRAGHGEPEERLPSLTEARHAIRVLFQLQLQSGIWNKYFALFHYPGAGSNYCFAFELLEAILNEFGEDLVVKEEVVFAGLEKAVAWCRDNRIKYHHNGEEYCGWNSGGDVVALSKGMPEAWSTAVVHMFLHKLGDVLTGLIEQGILERYRQVTTSRTWEEQLDSNVTLPVGRTNSVKNLIEEHLFRGLEKFKGAKRGDLKHAPLAREQRRSVLLFGPPGTSKTTLVRAFAQRKLNWPCIEITPSSFLDRGLPEIYQRATEVFDDLADLSGVVILFDEMDALSRRRDVPQGAGLDVTSQFLTTSMLPKLAKLHDDGRVVFFMLTNHRRDFDPAIMRPGRFDLLLCQGPPETTKKIDALPDLLKGSDDGAELEKAKNTLIRWMQDDAGTAKHLDQFTVDEFKALLETIKREHKKPLGEALAEMAPIKFATEVAEWAKNTIVLRDVSPPILPGSPSLLQEWEEDMKNSRLQ